MTIIKLFSCFAFISLFLLGCYQEIDLSVPYEGSKLVLEGYISPEKGLDLRIKKTFDPYEYEEFGMEGYYVPQATVMVWQDGELIDSCREVEKGHYLSFHPEKYSKNTPYKVRVTAPGFPETIVHDIRIPTESLVVPDQFKFNLVQEKESAYLEVFYQNPDQYAVYEGKAYYDSHEVNEVSMGPVYNDNPGAVCEADEIFISNKCEVGDSFRAEYFIDLYKSIPGEWEDEFLPKKYVYMEVGQVDPRYKTYITTSDASDEPFIEPTLDPGNVEGGYGYIVGWNTVGFAFEL